MAKAQVKSGCPAAAGRPPAHGDHCMPLPVTPKWVDTRGANGSCGQALFLQMKLKTGIVEYGAEWSWANPKANPPPASPWIFTATGGRHGTGSGPYAGEQTWSTTALTPKNTGVNVHYTVPKGFGAWFVSAGGGPGPCSHAKTMQKAWGWTALKTKT